MRAKGGILDLGSLAFRDVAADDISGNGSGSTDIIGLSPEMILATNMFEMRESETQIS